MKVVEANAVILDDSKLTPYQMIERVGRTCYKSEDLITDDSAVKFVGAMQKNRHFAMLEHYHLIFDCTKLAGEFEVIYEYPELIKYLNITNERMLLISGSFRAFLEFFENIEGIRRLTCFRKLQYKCHTLYPEIFDKPKVMPKGLTEIKNDIVYYTREAFIEFLTRRSKSSSLAAKHLTHTILFTCDRGVTHEFVRHRPASFAQESTRYCNYSKGKFGNEITVIDPCFWQGDDKAEFLALWLDAVKYCENIYFKMIELGATPQEARSVLPNSLKADLIITATEEEWKHIIALRYKGVTGKPHPQMVEVMTIAYNELVKASNGRLSIDE